MKTAALHFGGLPTGPDVEKLEAAFGIPAPKTVIQYDEIAAVIGAPYPSHRWNTVTNAWRRKLYRLHNVAFRCHHGTAFEAADASTRVDMASRGYKAGLRKVVRVAVLAARTDRSTLSPDERRKCDHLEQTAAIHQLAAKTSAKEAAFDFSKPTLPAWRGAS